MPEPFPRGIIDTTDGKCYECVRHSQWIANEGAGAWPGTAYYEPGAWPYTYTGFEDFASTGIHSGSVTRVYKRARTSHGMFVWENGFDRPILRQYSGSALLGTLDLTREFPRVDENGKHRIDYRSPTILEWVAAGNYLWVLAADWWAADDQRLGMILINKTSLLEVDRIDLSPIPGSLWLIETDWAGSGGRPQIWGGVDATGEPWAQVSAWWSGWHDSVIQEVRYVSSALSKAIISHTGWHDGGTQPARLTTVANIAIKPGAQFWLDAGVDLKKTTD